MNLRLLGGFKSKSSSSSSSSTTSTLTLIDDVKYDHHTVNRIHEIIQTCSLHCSSFPGLALKLNDTNAPKMITKREAIKIYMGMYHQDHLLFNKVISGDEKSEHMTVMDLIWLAFALSEVVQNPDLILSSRYSLLDSPYYIYKTSDRLLRSWYAAPLDMKMYEQLRESTYVHALMLSNEEAIPEMVKAESKVVISNRDEFIESIVGEENNEDEQVKLFSAADQFRAWKSMAIRCIMNIDAILLLFDKSNVSEQKIDSSLAMVIQSRLEKQLLERFSGSKTSTNESALFKKIGIGFKMKPGAIMWYKREQPFTENNIQIATIAEHETDANSILDTTDAEWRNLINTASRFIPLVYKKKFPDSFELTLGKDRYQDFMKRIVDDKNIHDILAFVAFYGCFLTRTQLNFTDDCFILGYEICDKWKFINSMIGSNSLKRLPTIIQAGNNRWYVQIPSDEGQLQFRYYDKATLRDAICLWLFIMNMDYGCKLPNGTDLTSWIGALTETPTMEENSNTLESFLPSSSSSSSSSSSLVDDIINSL